MSQGIRDGGAALRCLSPTLMCDLITSCRTRGRGSEVFLSMYSIWVFFFRPKWLMGKVREQVDDRSLQVTAYNRDI